MAYEEDAIMSETEVRITSKGLGAAQYLIAQLPVRIGKPVVGRIVNQVMKVGVDSMKESIRGSVGEKSTGALEQSISGEVTRLSDSEYWIRVGSPLEHARHAARSFTAQTSVHHVVKIMEGRWRFIGMRRAFTVDHPFITESANAMKQATIRLFTEKADRAAEEVFREAKAMEDTPDMPGAWFWEVD